jgi:septal ring factor EnvC (AmiA/AmiB activator)
MNFNGSQNSRIKKLLARGVGLFGILAIAVAATFVTTAFAQTVAGTSTSTAAGNSSLQAELDANNQQMAVLNQQIAQYQTELQQVGANKKTLQAAINSLNLQKNKVQTQISLTETQIKNTQLEIQQLGGQITSAQQTIATDQTALGAYLRSLQKADAKPLIVQMLSAGGLVQTWDDLNQTLQMQNGIQNEIQALGTTKNRARHHADRIGAKAKHADGATAIAHRTATVAPLDGTIQNPVARGDKLAGSDV